MSETLSGQTVRERLARMRVLLRDMHTRLQQVRASVLPDEQELRCTLLHLDDVALYDVALLALWCAATGCQLTPDMVTAAVGPRLAHRRPRPGVALHEPADPCDASRHVPHVATVCRELHRLTPRIDLIPHGGA